MWTIEQESSHNNKPAYRIWDETRSFSPGFFKYDKIHNQYIFEGRNTWYDISELNQILRLLESIEIN